MIDDLRTAEYVTRTLGGVRGALRQFLAEPSTRLEEAISFSTTIFRVLLFLPPIVFSSVCFGKASVCYYLASVHQGKSSVY